MTDLSLADLARLIAAANAARGWRGDTDGPVDEEAGVDAERRLDARFDTGRRLAVYGTLAPGRSNHHVVAPLGGEWAAGIVEGDLAPEGWGATLGFPALRPRSGGPDVAVHVLTSAMLAVSWPALDRFEGPAYRRVLVPVFRVGRAGGEAPFTVANLYAAASGGPDGPAR